MQLSNYLGPKNKNGLNLFEAGLILFNRFAGQRFFGGVDNNNLSGIARDYTKKGFFEKCKNK